MRIVIFFSTLIFLVGVWLATPDTVYAPATEDDAAVTAAVMLVNDE